MSPAEFYYALQAIGQSNEDAFKQQLIAARTTAFFVINNQIGMKREWLLKKETDLGYFYFEEGYKKPKSDGKQSPEEMKAILLGIAETHNRNVARKTRTTPPKTGKYAKKQE